MLESLRTTVWRKILICDILLSSTGKLSLLPRFTFKPETTGRHSKNHPRGAVAVSVKVHKSKHVKLNMYGTHAIPKQTKIKHI
jgi:hypothetical protein